MFLAKIALATFLFSFTATVRSQAGQDEFTTDRGAMAWKPGEFPLQVYVSVPDNLWMEDWPPVDSPATVKAQFERFSDTYRVKRVYWRGEQARIRLDNYLFRPESPRFLSWWQEWLRPKIYTDKNNEVAISEAHKRGMEIYAVDALFDHGTGGDAGGAGYFPYYSEDKLLLQHPEWASVDKWGERRNNGVMEFCYPEARKALVDRYVKYVAANGYDGLAFYTYVEIFGQRFQGEYGFNEPVVAEFKKRYGVDPRTQNYDRDKWMRLRGEYVTKFLKELRTALKAQGKELAVAVHGPKPDLPQPWPMDRDLPRPGNAYMDWQGWVDQGAVDEIVTWFGSDPTHFTPGAIAKVKGKGVKIGLFSGSSFAPNFKNWLQQGVTAAAMLAPGYSLDRFALKRVSEADLNSPDWKVRAEVMYQASMGKLGLDVSDIAPKLKDGSVLVRREAVRALGASKSSEATKALQTALSDSENAVRLAAVVALRKQGASNVNSLLNAVADKTSFQFTEAVARSLVEHRSTSERELILATTDTNAKVREVAVRALELNLGVAASNALAQVAKNDSSKAARYFAVLGLGRRGSGDALPTLISLVDDPDTDVQVWVGQAFYQIGKALAAQNRAEGPKQAMLKLFKRFGDGSTRDDRSWGWRPVGNALVAMGAEAELEAFRKGSDKRLAWAAYQVLHMPLFPMDITVMTEAEADRIHDQYAPPFPGF